MLQSSSAGVLRKSYVNCIRSREGAVQKLCMQMKNIFDIKKLIAALKHISELTFLSAFKIVFPIIAADVIKGFKFLRKGKVKEKF